MDATSVGPLAPVEDAAPAAGADLAVSASSSKFTNGSWCAFGFGLPRRRMGRLGSLMGSSRSEVLVVAGVDALAASFVESFEAVGFAESALLDSFVEAFEAVESFEALCVASFEPGVGALEAGAPVELDGDEEDAGAGDVDDEGCDDVDDAAVPVEGTDVVLDVDVAAPVVAVPVDGVVVEPAAGFDSSLSAVPAARRCSTGRSSLFSSSIIGSEYFLCVSGVFAPAGSHVPSAIQSWRSCPGCVMVKRPCDTPV